MNEQKAKHTPGPWISEARQQGFAIWADYENAPGEYVAIINGYESSKEDRERNRANARLIAAAPELLAALETLVSWADNDQERNGYDFVQQARAAIRKARAE